MGVVYAKIPCRAMNEHIHSTRKCLALHQKIGQWVYFYMRDFKIYFLRYASTDISVSQ